MRSCAETDLADDDDSRRLCAGAGAAGESGEYDECVLSSYGVADEDADSMKSIEEIRIGVLLPVATVDHKGSTEGKPPMDDMVLLDDGMFMDDMAGVDSGIEEI